VVVKQYAWTGLLAGTLLLTVGAKFLPYFPGDMAVTPSLSDLPRDTDKAQSFTLGLNWFPNRHIRFQFNFDHAWFDAEILQSREVENDVLATLPR
jgi:hypothetical protein